MSRKKDTSAAASATNSRQQRMAAARTKRLRRAWADAILVIHVLMLGAATFLCDAESPALIFLAQATPFAAALFLLLRHWRMP